MNILLHIAFIYVQKIRYLAHGLAAPQYHAKEACIPAVKPLPMGFASQDCRHVSLYQNNSNNCQICAGAQARRLPVRSYDVDNR